jgi:hypothetical protein
MNAYELAKELKEGTCIQVGSLKLKELADVLIQMADYIKHLEQGLESSIALNKAQLERLSDLERKHKEEFDYAENLLKEKQK